MHTIRNHGNKVVSNVIILKININYIGVLLSQIYLTYLIEIVTKNLSDIVFMWVFLDQKCHQYYYMATLLLVHC